MERRRREEGGAAAAEADGRLADAQRLKAAVHYTVACLCEEVEEDKETQFSKQAIAAISEITFRQCDIFAKDLEMFARHAKRSTINVEDVKLLARRSSSLLRYITQKSEELALNNREQKEKRKKNSSSKKGRRTSDEPAEPAVAESEDCHMYLQVPADLDRSELLAFLSELADWASRMNEAPLTRQVKMTHIPREERAPFSQPPTREKVPCKNFFWKTFSSC